MSPVQTRSTANASNTDNVADTVAENEGVEDNEPRDTGSTHESIIPPDIITSGQEGEHTSGLAIERDNLAGGTETHEHLYSVVSPVDTERKSVKDVSQKKQILENNTNSESLVQVSSKNEILRNLYTDRATLAKLAAQKPHDWPSIDKTSWTRWSKKTIHWLNERGLQWCISNEYKHLSNSTNIQYKFEITIAQNALSMLAGPTEDAEILDAITPWDAWYKLETKYRHKSMLRAQELETQIENLVYHNEPIATWFDSVIKTRRELTEIGEEFHMSDKAVLNKMFRALPEEFRTELSIIRREITKGECTIDDVRQTLMDAELEINRGRKSKGIPSINSIRGRGHWNRTMRSRGRGYHNMNNRAQGPNNEQKCFKCHQPGHFARNCPQNKTQYHSHTNNKVSHVVASTHIAKPNEAFIAPAIFDENEPKALSVGQHQFWILDSGATHHITGDWNALQNPKELQTNRHLSLGNNNKLHATHEGSIRIGLEGQYCTLKSVLFAPDMAVSLVSVSQLASEGIFVTFNSIEATLRDQKGIKVAQAKREGNLYLLGISIPANIESHFVGFTIATWHRRLGHLNVQDLKVTERVVDGMKIDSITNDKLDLCHGCELGKQSRIPFSTDQRRASEPLELIHSDLMEFPIYAIGLSPQHVKDKWAAVFVDDFSRYIYVWITSQKSNVCYAFMRFKAYFEKLLNRSIKTLRTDGGTEYMGLKEFLIEQGIAHQVTTPYTPQSNGVAERANRTLAETMRAFLYQFKEPLRIELWGFALLAAAQVRNFCSKRINDGITPHELFLGKRPNIEYLRTFGCKTYFHIPDETRNKLQPKARIGILVGYRYDLKAYWVWEPFAERLHITRDIRFDENCTIKIENNQVIDIPVTTHLQLISSSENSDYQESDTITNEEENQNDSQIITENDTSLREITTSPPEILRRSQRTRKLSRKLIEGAMFHLIDFSPRTLEPTTYREAIESEYKEKWIDAMKAELSTHLQLGTWKSINTLPVGRKAISSKWHFRVKQGPDGQIVKFKARLVARGFTQIEGEDYSETFAPVMKFQTLRTLLALAVENNWYIYQLDVVTAYLNGKLQEEIYMLPPTGYNELLQLLGYPTQLNNILHLRLALYGLKQSGRTWYQTLDQVLISELQLIRSTEDECVYYRIQNQIYTIVAIYVDDILLITQRESDAINIKSRLMQQFKMTDNGLATWILGIKITQTNGQIQLSQATHILNLLGRFGMTNCRPTPTPLPIGCVQAISNGNSNKIEQITYQQAIGSLMYLMVGTRPDIAFAVSFLSQFAANPKECHWKLVKHVMKYLKGTVNFGLIFRCSKAKLTGYSDADYANDKSDRKSFSGYTFHLASATISWKSHKQNSVALSTMEAECIALTDAVCEAIWFRRFLKEIQMQYLFENDMVTIYCDNNAAIEITKNPVFHKRAKHIDIRYRRIREEIEKKTVNIQYIPSKSLVADALTKPTTGKLFIEQRDALGVKLCSNLTAPSNSGGVGNDNPQVQSEVAETKMRTAQKE